MKDKSSALIRVLLSLYFNKKLASLKFQGIDLENLIEVEMKESQEAQVKGSIKGVRKRKEIALAKKNGTF